MKSPTFQMRTVKSWVRYIPGAKFILGKGYRTKKEALSKQRVGEVVFQIKGHYFPLMAKKKRAGNGGAEHG